MTETFKSILVLAKRLQSLNQEAVLAYTPIVDDILRSSKRLIKLSNNGGVEKMKASCSPSQEKVS